MSNNCVRDCPSCKTGYIMSYDLHAICKSCLGPEHAYAALSQQVACSHCARLPSADRKRRADALAAAAEEDDWPVQEHRDNRLSLEPSAGQESDDSYPVSLHGHAALPSPPDGSEVEGFTEEGFPTTPALDPSLTAFFGVRQANLIAGRRPTLASPKDQYVARQADRAHQCAVQASAVANNIALLANSVVTLVERPTTVAPEEAEEIGKAASTALTLCAYVAVSQARIEAWMTQIQRHLWLQQAAVTEPARKVLLDAPISSEGLFGPQFLAMVESMKAAAEQVDDIRQHVGWLQPAAKPQRHQRQAERQPRRQTRPSAAAGAPSRTSAPPPEKKKEKYSRSSSAPREPPRKQSRP
ncbi:uncharacterized protein [Notothenia coriiceps]|uniref:Uncharacterized protein n=1 Tax=Notothenia coriiceps TaxID=8208 RepID=A0A6I9PQU5_9TELE|nr:PREDICTED: uncharacterized protein LOC104963197 [Notothenia coriiceps]